MTCGSRGSPRNIFAYCSVVNSVTRSERPRSVNDTAMSMSTGTAKKMTVRRIAGPRKITKLARRRAADRAWPRRSIISSFAVVVIVRPDREPGRRAARRSAGPVERYCTITSSSDADASSMTKSAASSAVSRPLSTPWIAV